jgi:hypothetical protein
MRLARRGPGLGSRDVLPDGEGIPRVGYRPRVGRYADQAPVAYSAKGENGERRARRRHGPLEPAGTPRRSGAPPLRRGSAPSALRVIMSYGDHSPGRGTETRYGVARSAGEMLLAAGIGPQYIE